MKRIEKNVIMKKIIICLVLFIFEACVPVSKKIPQVNNNKLYFLDNKTQIQIGKNDFYHIFSDQNRLVFISCQQKSNSRDYSIIFFDFHGKKIAQPDTVSGEIVFLFAETSKRVLAGQHAVLTRQNDSYLYDLDGNLLKVLNSTYDTKQIGMTNDENYFWFAENKMRPLRLGEKATDPLLPNTFLYSHIMFFDALTGEFLTEYNTQESPFILTINGKRYTIPVSPPDIPG